MSRTYFRYFERDNGDEVQVEYSLDGGSAPSGMSGPPENYDPGSSPEVCSLDCWLVADENKADAPRVTMTDAEYERFAEEVIADPETWEPEYEDDMS